MLTVNAVLKKDVQEEAVLVASIAIDRSKKKTQIFFYELDERLADACQLMLAGNAESSFSKNKYYIQHFKHDLALIERCKDRRLKVNKEALTLSYYLYSIPHYLSLVFYPCASLCKVLKSPAIAILMPLHFVRNFKIAIKTRLSLHLHSSFYIPKLC